MQLYDEILGIIIARRYLKVSDNVKRSEKNQIDVLQNLTKRLL